MDCTLDEKSTTTITTTTTTSSSMGSAGKHYILIVDESYSMKSTWSNVTAFFGAG